MFITFITQKLHKNEIRLFHSLLMIFFLCSCASIPPSYKPFSSKMSKIATAMWEAAMVMVEVATAMVEVSMGY